MDRQLLLKKIMNERFIARKTRLIFKKVNGPEFSTRQNMWLVIKKSRDIVIVENIHLVRLLDLTADFGVKTKRKIDADFQDARGEQYWYSELSVHRNPDSKFCVNLLKYIL